MRRTVLGLSLLVAILAACTTSTGGGGGGGPAGDPVAAVNNVLNAIKAKNFSAIGPMLCTSKRDELLKDMNLPGSGASTAPGGLDMQQFVDALTVTFENLSVTQDSNDGTKAVVTVKGTLKTTMDRAKAKDIARQMFAGQSPGPSEQQLDQFADQMAAGQTTNLDNKVEVVKEENAWLVCSNPSTSD
jgi:hypothetical protein